MGEAARGTGSLRGLGGQAKAILLFTQHPFVEHPPWCQEVKDPVFMEVKSEKPPYFTLLESNGIVPPGFSLVPQHSYNISSKQEVRLG